MIYGKENHLYIVIIKYIKIIFIYIKKIKKNSVKKLQLFKNEFNGN